MDLPGILLGLTAFCFPWVIPELVRGTLEVARRRNPFQIENRTGMYTTLPRGEVIVIGNVIVSPWSFERAFGTTSATADRSPDRG